MAAAVVTTAPAAWTQQGTHGRTYRANANSEQHARARWQPVRPAQATEELPPPAGSAAASRSAQETRSRSSASQVPLPDANGHSVMRRQGEFHGEVHPGEIYLGEVPHDSLDGQIIYEGGGFAGNYGGHESYGLGGCDAMGGCAGGCDHGCDSLGSCGPGGCGPGGCDPCAGGWRPCLTLCFPQNGWVSMEYLNWYQRGMNLPPLVTTSVGQLPPRSQAGVLGGPTRILFGGDEVLEDSFSGGRLQVGLWLDRCHTWAAVGEYFELSGRSESFSGNSNGFPVLARPFFNTLTGAEDSQIVSYPGFATGSLSAEVSSELVGGGFHLRRQTNSGSGCGHGLLCDGCSMFHSRTDVLFGYRYVQLDEAVGVTENLVGTSPGESFHIQDRFRTLNQFNGFDMGMAYNRTRGCWSVDLLAKLAIGNTRQRVDINGTTSIDGGAPQQGGLLAQTTNIGSYSRDQFSMVPELGATLGYQLTHNLRLKAGYTLIFWSNVVRPGDQIDRDVNPNLFPPAVVGGAARPHFEFDDTSYWAQGVNLGAEFTW